MERQRKKYGLTSRRNSDHAILRYRLNWLQVKTMRVTLKGFDQRIQKI